jgi:hypothetical protein
MTTERRDRAMKKNRKIGKGHIKVKMALPLHAMSAMYPSTASGVLAFPIFFTLYETDIVSFVCVLLSFSAASFLPVDDEDGAGEKLRAREFSNSKVRTPAVDGIATCCFQSSRDLTSLLYIDPGERRPGSMPIMV